MLSQKLRIILARVSWPLTFCKMVFCQSHAALMFKCAVRTRKKYQGQFRCDKERKINGSQLFNSICTIYVIVKYGILSFLLVKFHQSVGKHMAVVCVLSFQHHVTTQYCQGLAHKEMIRKCLYYLYMSLYLSF